MAASTDMTDVIKTSKRLSVNEIRESVDAASAFVAKHHKDPNMCVGYLWATLAGLLVKCGDPRPPAPWPEA